MPPVPQQLVVFRAAGQLYALPIGNVREVVGEAPRRSIPQPPAPWVAGMASIRGELLPVVDLGRRLGAEPSADRDQVLLVIEHRGRPVALAVERVDKISPPGAATVTPAPDYAGDAAKSVAELDGELIVVLKPEALLPPKAEAKTGGTTRRRT